jgi:predicted PurR-regulated permease PerM
MAASARSNILFAFAVALLLWLLYLVRDVVMLVYVSALFAVVVTPALEAMQRARIGRWHPSRAVALVVLLVVGLGALSLFGIFPAAQKWTSMPSRSARHRCWGAPSA